MGELIINHWAVLAAAVSNMVLGALWYSPSLFGKAWMRENDLTDEDLANTNMPLMYGGGFALALVIAYNLAAFLGNAETDALWGATAGFLAGFGFAAAMFASVALFEQRSIRYILINGAFMTVVFTVMGLIIGAWR